MTAINKLGEFTIKGISKALIETIKEFDENYNHDSTNVAETYDLLIDEVSTMMLTEAYCSGIIANLDSSLSGVRNYTSLLEVIEEIDPEWAKYMFENNKFDVFQLIREMWRLCIDRLINYHGMIDENIFSSDEALIKYLEELSKIDSPDFFDIFYGDEIELIESKTRYVTLVVDKILKKIN
ncbi:hypothetical protein FP435_00230 (plasmid) [Lactobacillus sp. PV037]|uniref:hypothetical protein n=1 Tax=Lactobacillus sp. PV037 TaxID=2594496 RepID=UPI00223F7F56|nr:hypothetical protein [Lactobacillus sp. PV037]QNQ82965.1 hypothetical protein FP435_00230 [Lactobacillus sp. PV037]